MNLLPIYLDVAQNNKQCYPQNHVRYEECASLLTLDSNAFVAHSWFQYC